MSLNTMYNLNSILSSEYNKIEKNSRIYLCIYNISNIQFNPILMYLLYKYPELDILSYPNFKLKRKAFDEIKQFYFDITNANNDPEGYLIFNNDVYVFFELKINFKVQNRYKSENELWWTTIYEMCNSKQLLYFKIHKTVTEIFMKYTKLIYLVDDNNIPYVIPRIGYYGCYHSLISYVTLLGIQQSSYAPYGNFYYFNNFKRAIKYGGWSFGGSISDEKHIIKDKHNKYDKGGIVRFAIFLNNTKMFLNHPDDKKTKNIKSTDADFYKDIPRLVDMTGEWASNHDSAYVGILNIKKNGEETTFHGSIREQYIVKDISSYFSLSSHIIDRKTLGDEWKLEDEYKII
jgi:hypothetical protein